MDRTKPANQKNSSGPSVTGSKAPLEPSDKQSPTTPRQTEQEKDIDDFVDQQQKPPRNTPNNW